MRLIKQFLKMLVLFLTVFLFYSCSGEDVNNQQRESTEIHIPGKKESNERYLIASIIEDEVIWDFSLNELENHILENEILQIIESINIDYGLNPEENKKEAFLTVIGFQDEFTVAYQAELIIEADDIFIGDIEKEPFLFNKHTCTGDGCSSCSFKRNWFLGKVQGCECNSANGSCNHSISNEGGLFTKLINFFI